MLPKLLYLRDHFASLDYRPRLHNHPTILEPMLLNLLGKVQKIWGYTT